MVIHNQLMKICDECPCFELETEIYDMYADNHVVSRIINLGCKNEQLCHEIHKQAKKDLERADNS